MQNTVNAQARQNIINAIEQGSVKESKWWLERFDNPEPIICPIFGGKEEGLHTMIGEQLNVEENYIGYEKNIFKELAE